jgi:putative oxidoreductase
MEIDPVTEPPKKQFPRRYLMILRMVCRFILGALFVFAGTTKIYDPGAFAIELERYQLVPWQVGAAIADYLPWLELAAGLSLFYKRLERGALLLVTVLLAIFTLALVSALFRGLSIDCGCFGKALLSTGTVVPILRNLFLLLLAGILWVR